MSMFTVCDVNVHNQSIGNAANAGLLAGRILGATNPAILDKIREYMDEQEDIVTLKAEKLEKKGWKDYLHNTYVKTLPNAARGPFPSSSRHLPP